MSSSRKQSPDIDHTLLSGGNDTHYLKADIVLERGKVKRRKPGLEKITERHRKDKRKEKKSTVGSKGSRKNVLFEFPSELHEPNEVKLKSKDVGGGMESILTVSKEGKGKIPRLKKSQKEKRKSIRQRKVLKNYDAVNIKSNRRKRKPPVPESLQVLWSSDDENENKNIMRGNGSWEAYNMAASTGLAHRSDHSYDERDDLFFDSDDEREADIMENSDEDTEDASETDMATLEEEFTEMKEQMYQEKIKDLRHQLEQLRQGIHPDYLSKLKDLEQQKEDWILMADAFKEYELREIEKEYEKEKRQAKEEYEMKKVDLKESLIIELTEKKKNIESERMTLELAGDILEVKPVSTRKLRRRPNEPPPAPENKKRKTNAKAQLNFLLPEDSILADLKKLNKLAKNQASPTERTERQPQPRSPLHSKSDSDQELSHGPPYEAKIEEGKLYYEKKCFTKGQAIFLETKESCRIIAQIHSIGTNEVWIKKIQENTRLKLYLSHLQKGKYLIKRRSSVQHGREG